MDLNVFAKEVHQNAVEHGWWDEDRSPLEVAALIHSELSEALEEYRAGRPMVWHNCTSECDDNICTCGNMDWCDLKNDERTKCIFRDKKPEGIAVELIDCVIRIMDYAANRGMLIDEEPVISGHFDRHSEGKLPEIVASLHLVVATALSPIFPEDKDEESAELSIAIGMIFKWVRKQGLEPEAIMLEKHQYNKTRSYKHGGKKC